MVIPTAKKLLWGAIFFIAIAGSSLSFFPHQALAAPVPVPRIGTKDGDRVAGTNFVFTQDASGTAATEICALYETSGGGISTERLACTQPNGTVHITNLQSGTGGYTAYNPDGTVVATGHETGIVDTQRTIGVDPVTGAASSNAGTGSITGGAVGGVAQAINGCLTDLKQCLINLVWDIIYKIALFFLLLATMFLGVIGLLLNWVLTITVFQFGNVIGNSAGLLAAWGVLRDMGNIALLFGFIFMGISTILNLPSSEYTAKKALPALIIFAVLLNFSLFAAEAIIDTSNAFAITFFNQSSNGLCPQNLSASGLIDQRSCAENFGIGGKIIEITGVGKIFDMTQTTQLSGADPLKKAITAIGLTLFVFTAAFVLLAAVIMLITRAVVLAFLMVLSPVGFAGMAVPPLHSYAKQWWGAILKQSFFAPLYLLFVLISIKMTEGILIALGTGNATTNPNLASVFTSSGVSNISIVVTFGLIIGFLIGSMEIARSLGAIGADFATKTAGGIVFGGSARIAGGIVGLPASGLRRLTRGVPVLGQVTNTLLSPLEKMNLDPRKLPIYGTALERSGKPSEHASFDAMKGQVRGVKEELSKSAAEYNKSVGMDRLKSEIKSGSTTLTPESKQLLASLSADEIAANHDLMHSIDKFAKELSADKFDKILENSHTTAADKERAMQGRYGDLRAASGGPYDSTKKDVVRGFSKKDIEIVGKNDPATLSAIMDRFDPATGEGYLSDKQAEALADSNSLTSSQRDKAESSTRKGRTDDAVKDSRQADAITYMGSMSAKNKAKLKPATLADAAVAATLTPADLQEIQREGNLDAGQRSSIAAAVRAGVNGPAFTAWTGGNANAASYWR